MRVMIVGIASSLVLLLGVLIAGAGPSREAIAAARAEVVGGGLLATGLVLIGVGIQSSFG